MAKKNKSSDVNLTALEILNSITGEPPTTSSHWKTGKKKDPPKKNPAAVEVGRLRGLKGGKSRGKAPSDKRRAEITRAAAKARWSN